MAIEKPVGHRCVLSLVIIGKSIVRIYISEAYRQLERLREPLPDFREEHAGLGVSTVQALPRTCLRILDDFPVKFLLPGKTV